AALCASLTQCAERFRFDADCFTTHVAKCSLFGREVTDSVEGANPPRAFRLQAVDGALHVSEPRGETYETAFAGEDPLLRHVRTRVRSPQTNGVIERFFGTLKYEHLYRAPIDDGG